MAHRGASALAPENTLAAFARAMDTRATWLELDVHLSRDGEVIVMHDHKVDRTTNGSGAIAEMTLAELKALDAGSWFGAEFANEPVPTLGEIIELVGERLRFNVEIKSGVEATAPTIALLKEAGLLAQSMISSFNLEAVLEARKHTEEPLLALITGHAEHLEPAVEHGLDYLNLHYPAATEELVARAHAAKVRVCIWTLDDPVQWPVYEARGAAVICTNAPHLAG